LVKYELVNDLLGPVNVKTIEYSGPNTVKVLDIAKGALKDILRITSTALFEDELKWDKSAMPICFYYSLRAKKVMDKHSTLWYNIKIQGTKNQDGAGKITVWISGKLETTIDSPIPGMHLIYKNIFYKNQRLKYTEEGKKYIEMMEDVIRDNFEMIRR